jgi:translocation protein SEC63
MQVRPFDPFEILGVAPGATEKEIKRAYRQLSLKFHPDKASDEVKGLHVVFV